jgi:hypothetical protein
MKHLLKNKNKPESFEGMSQKEKKEFLSMDLIERLIRIEQRVSTKFHKFVRYNETEYYKSLPEQKKKEFEKYLKWKKGKKALLVLLSFLPLVVLVVFAIKSGLTGRAVGIDSEGEFGILSYFVVGICVAIGIIFAFAYALKRKRKQKLEGHFDVLEESIGIKKRGK